MQRRPVVWKPAREANRLSFIERVGRRPGASSSAPSWIRSRFTTSAAPCSEAESAAATPSSASSISISPPSSIASLLCCCCWSPRRVPGGAAVSAVASGRQAGCLLCAGRSLVRLAKAEASVICVATILIGCADRGVDREISVFGRTEDRRPGLWSLAVSVLPPESVDHRDTERFPISQAEAAKPKV